MTNILVDIDSLHDTSKYIRRTLRDMDECVRRAYNDIHSIRDSGRGLNEVRHRADELLRAHRALEEAGIRVEQYASWYADAFASADQELASMVRSQLYVDNASYMYVLRSIASTNQLRQTLLTTIATHAEWLKSQINGTSIWDLATRYTMISTLAAQLRTTAISDWAKHTALVMGSMGLLAVHASQIQASATLLASFLPSNDGLVARRLDAIPIAAMGMAGVAALVPVVVAGVSAFGHNSVLGTLQTWAERVVARRNDDPHTARNMALAPLAYMYDVAVQHIIDGSSGIASLGAQANAHYVAVLSANLAQCQLRVSKWVVTH